MYQQVLQSLSRLHRRIMSMIGIGKVTLVDDKKNNQYVQVKITPDQTIEARKIGHYGYAYSPPENSDALVIFLTGNRQNGVVIGTELQSARLKELKPGECGIYDDLGQSVYLTREGIVINGGGLPMRIENTDGVTIDDDLTVNELKVNDVLKVTQISGEGSNITADTPVFGCTGTFADHV